MYLCLVKIRVNVVIMIQEIIYNKYMYIVWFPLCHRCDMLFNANECIDGLKMSGGKQLKLKGKSLFYCCCAYCITITDLYVCNHTCQQTYCIHVRSLIVKWDGRVILLIVDKLVPIKILRPSLSFLRLAYLILPFLAHLAKLVVGFLPLNW